MLLLVFTVVYMIYGNILQSNYQISELNCDSTKVILEEEVEKVSSLFDCFCYQKATSFESLSSLSSYSFEIGKETKTCEDWLSDLVLRYTIFYGNVIVIFILNAFNDFFSRFLSEFEAHNNLNAKYSSNMLKSFFFKLFNTALLVLIINARIRFDYGSGNLAFGSYDELTVNWFLSVGLSILLTVFWEGVVYPFTQFIMVIISKIPRCLDRRCRFSSKNTRKKMQSDYQTLYTDGEFLMVTYLTRAAVIIWIGLFYAPGMPITFALTAFYLGILYWTTKIKLLCFSAKPPFYGMEMQKRVRSIIEWAILFHILLAFWIFGNNSIIIDGSVNFKVSEYIGDLEIPEWNGVLLYVVRYVRKMFGRSTSIFTLAALLITIILIFIRFGLFELARILQKIFFKCLGNCRKRKKEKEPIGVYQTEMNKDEIKDEIKLLSQMINNSLQIEEESKAEEQNKMEVGFFSSQFLKKKYQERIQELQKVEIQMVSPKSNKEKYKGLHSYNFMVKSRNQSSFKGFWIEE